MMDCKLWLSRCGSSTVPSPSNTKSTRKCAQLSNCSESRSRLSTAAMLRMMGCWRLISSVRSEPLNSWSVIFISRSMLRLKPP